MRKINKLIIIELYILILTLCGYGCSNKKQYSDHSFIIIINADYKDNFQERLFKLDDFDYDNVLTYSYASWSEKNDTGSIFIFLKEVGDKEVDKAIVHFNQLYFVERCEKIPLKYLQNNRD